MRGDVARATEDRVLWLRELIRVEREVHVALEWQRDDINAPTVNWVLKPQRLTALVVKRLGFRHPPSELSGDVLHRDERVGNLACLLVQRLPGLRAPSRDDMPIG